VVPIISVVGPSKADKTLLVERLISELEKRGYRVATVKRDAHNHDLDTPGKTSWRHSQAGAESVIVSAPEKITMFKKVAKEWALDEIAKKFLSDSDIVITDGFTNEKKPKIKVLLSQAEEDSQVPSDELFSIVGGKNSEKSVPKFNLEEIEKLADLIEEKFLKKR